MVFELITYNVLSLNKRFAVFSGAQIEINLMCQLVHLCFGTFHALVEVGGIVTWQVCS